VSSEAATRRRGAALDEALLEAAWDELAAAGYSNLTMEAVAARAGTSKPVLYRRWPSRAELIIAAVAHKTPRLTPASIVDTGSLRGDMLALLRVASRRFSGLFREALQGVLSDCYRDPELSAHLHADTFGNAARVMPVILGRAADRGEVDTTTIPPRVASVALDLFRHELLTSHGPIPKATLVQIVDEVFLPLVLRTGAPAVC
jgi:AcrR family transcriptional regulator